MTRLAVIGLGAMGANHARVLRQLPEVELVGVADTDHERAERHAALTGARAYTDHCRLLEELRPQAVTVAVPINLHHRVARDALAAGCHVLLEKPIAASLEEAQDLVEAARQAGRLLSIGHVERYNPAIIDLKRRLDSGQAGRIIQVHARRLGPFPERIRDVGVIIDLATHDVDVMCHLIQGEAVSVYAATRREVATSNEDLMVGMIHFQRDVLGLLEINWLTPTKIRELWVTGERGMFRADYLTQDLYFYENQHAGHPGDIEWQSLSILKGVSEGAMTRFPLERVEPLTAEMQAFVAAVEGRPALVVTAEDGTRALKLALALADSGHQRRSIEL